MKSESNNAAKDAVASNVVESQATSNASAGPPTTPVPLTRSDIKWLIGRYEVDATEADAVGADDCVEYDDQRIKELTAALSNFEI